MPDRGRAPGAAAEERLANDPRSELWGEHLSRYHFAARLLAGRTVLDVACGAGFGLRLLREAGITCLGMDLDAGALRDARATLGALPVAVADALRLPLADGALGGVVSCETIEHVPDARAFVAEIARVLGADGVALFSTPNRDFGPPELHHNNPFHVQEFTADELMSLLGACFERVTVYGQWPDPRYRYVPFRMVASTGRADEWAWKALNRLPYAWKDGQARLLSGGYSFYPGEHDYRFEPGRWDGAHDLVAVCERPRHG